MRRKTSQLKIARYPKKKKNDTSKEVVKICDQCKNPLHCSVQRTIGSATCASIHGIFARKYKDNWLFFCTYSCLEKHVKDNQQESGKNIICGGFPEE